MNLTWYEQGYIQGCLKVTLEALEDHFGVLPDELKQRMIALIQDEMRKHVAKIWPLESRQSIRSETPVQS